MTLRISLALFVAALVMLAAPAPLRGSDAPPLPPVQRIAIKLPPLPPELGVILHNVEEARKKVRRLAADIVQDREVEALEITEKFTGAMKFEMPRLLRLELKRVPKGDATIRIVGEKYAWVYWPQKKTAQRATLKKVEEKKPKENKAKEKEKKEQTNPLEYGLARDIN